MSHELRTPLNSLLILARLLADNTDGNLTDKQVEFAETIHSAGSDLLELINDILDLSKIEAGRMDVQAAPIAVSTLVEYVEATFRPLTVEKGLDFNVRLDPKVPAELYTDEQRLQQILRNLLSNAVKFTESGSVELRVTVEDDVPVAAAIESDAAQTGQPARAIAFAVRRHRHRHRRRRSCASSSRRSSRPTARPAASTAAPASACRSAARSRTCSAAESPSARRWDAARPSRSTCRCGSRRNRPARSSAGTGTRLPEQRGVADAQTMEKPLASTAVRRSRPGQGQLFLGREAAREESPRFAGRFNGETVLIVDDDIRNVFALTSVLEQRGLSVLLRGERPRGRRRARTCGSTSTWC